MNKIYIDNITLFSIRDKKECSFDLVEGTNIFKSTKNGVGKTLIFNSILYVLGIPNETSFSYLLDEKAENKLTEIYFKVNFSIQSSLERVSFSLTRKYYGQKKPENGRIILEFNGEVQIFHSKKNYSNLMDLSKWIFEIMGIQDILTYGKKGSNPPVYYYSNDVYIWDILGFFITGEENQGKEFKIDNQKYRRIAEVNKKNKIDGYLVLFLYLVSELNNSDEIIFNQKEVEKTSDEFKNLKAQIDIYDNKIKLFEEILKNLNFSSSTISDDSLKKRKKEFEKITNDINSNLEVIKRLDREINILQKNEGRISNENDDIDRFNSIAEKYQKLLPKDLSIFYEGKNISVSRDEVLPYFFVDQTIAQRWENSEEIKKIQAQIKEKKFTLKKHLKQNKVLVDDFNIKQSEFDKLNIESNDNSIFLNRQKAEYRKKMYNLKDDFNDKENVLKKLSESMKGLEKKILDLEDSIKVKFYNHFAKDENDSENTLIYNLDHFPVSNVDSISKSQKPAYAIAKHYFYLSNINKVNFFNVFDIFTSAEADGDISPFYEKNLKNLLILAKEKNSQTIIFKNFKLDDKETLSFLLELNSDDCKIIDLENERKALICNPLTNEEEKNKYSSFFD